MKNPAKKILISGCALLLLSCNSKVENQETTTTENPQVESKSADATQNPGKFDIESIPVSDKPLGEFPFFSLPKGVQEQNKAVKRSYDMLFFPIDGVMTPLNGKVWKTNVVVSKDNPETWSLPYFLSSYDEIITAKGGVKIFDAKVSKAEMDRIKDQATYFGEEGSVDYWNEAVKTYVIRRPAGDDVYVQISGNSSAGVLQILQKAALKQTITMLTADQIQKDLAEKGKAVLYVNFDTNKAVMKPDGLDAVAEIDKALKADKTIKIAIHGYTDNAGEAAYNLDLSKKRAKAVKSELEKRGIEASRLVSEGFGQTNPIADNATEEGKAQNRRVELVKK